LADNGLFTASETYERNLEDAVNAGAFGAPFYITDGDERFWGQDRLDDLDAHLAGDL
jgi:2-hydroxychromene-2-carboxylate isomerase